MSDKGNLTITTPSDREVTVTRVFSAPGALVFDALTKPELLRRWYGPTGWSLLRCEIDLRVGGKWHFVSRHPNGNEIGQLGVYQEIAPGEKLVNTENWEDWDAGETLVTTVLSEQNGVTTLTSTMLFPSESVRDTVLKGGLEHGTKECYDKLEEVLSEVESEKSVAAG
jgi:uncharacterized protein YndB with AHSA1/START domain